MQFATGQHRLQQIACIHTTFRLTCTHDGVQLIDKENNFAIGVLHFIQNSLQSLFELTPILGTGDEGTHIQRENGTVLKTLRYILFDDSLCKTFRNGRFTNTGFTDQNRIVLCLSGQDPNHIPDLLVSADYRVLLLFPCPFDKIRTVFFKGIIGSFRIVGGNSLVSANTLQRFQSSLLCNAVHIEQPFHAISCTFQQSKENMLHRYEFIVHDLCLILCRCKCGIRIRRDIEPVSFPASADARQFVQFCYGGRFKAFYRNIHLFKQLRDQASLLAQKGNKQMDLFQLGISVLHSQLLSTLHGLQ